MASIHSVTEEKEKLIQDYKRLLESLADETKVKNSLFSFVSETCCKQKATEEQITWEQY